MKNEITIGTPMCSEHGCTYVCLKGVELHCPICLNENAIKAKELAKLYAKGAKSK